MLVQYLKNVPLFNQLNGATLKEIASRCRNARVKKGEVIFRKTDLSTDLYIVKSGKLNAILEDEGGGEIVLAHFGEGDFFGELSLLDGKGRSATIIAEADSELSILKKELFFELLYKEPKITVELMATLVERLRKADEMIESLAFYEVSERLLRALMESAKPDGTAKAFLKAEKQTHKELAARIGSSREAVSKCMKILSTKGIVKETEGFVLIAADGIDRLKVRS